MTADRIQWYAENEKYFSQVGQKAIFSMLEDIDEETFQKAKKLKFKDPGKAFMLSVLCGWLGIDRFYIKSPIVGLIKMGTLGGLFVLYIIDLYTIKKRTIKYNNKLALKCFNANDEVLWCVENEDDQGILENNQKAASTINTIINIIDN